MFDNTSVLPTSTNKADLYEAWKRHTENAADDSEETSKIQIALTMTTVENATMRFESFSCLASMTTMSNDTTKNRKIDDDDLISALANVKIPAMTSVQECRRLETGVGPSIASGSQR